MKKLLLLFFFITSHAVAQQRTIQTVKGSVVEEYTFVPVVGATIIINADTIYYAVTDVEGNFSLTHIPVGNISLRVTSIGYEDISIPSLNLVSGKQLALDLTMKESLHQLDEVQITAIDRTKSRNELGTVSSRLFLADEANRYAGSLGDVARMASNYAGVAGNDDGSNDLVIRGNAPGGVLWRIDGVDVFNPNHFGDGSAAGGPVSMVNNNLLSSSDFFTGAFPATYGNALSGAFDLYLRNGNKDRHEFTGQVGFAGFELGAEGPISKKHKATYIIAARYSMLDVISKLGIDFGTGTAIPRYTDLTAKINLPTQNAGTFSLFLLGGMNSIHFPEGETGNYYRGKGRLYDRGKLGVASISHACNLNSSTYYKLSLSYQYSEKASDIDTLDLSGTRYGMKLQNSFVRQRAGASLFVNKKMSSRLALTAGTRITNEWYDLHALKFTPQETIPTIKDKDHAWQIEVYGQLLYRPFEWLKLTPGINFKHLLLNHTQSIDPRFGASILIKSNQEFNVGYGHVSQLQPIYLYGIKSASDISPNYRYDNALLGMTKAHHFVLGYQWKATPSLRIKSEVYFQALYNIPVTERSGIFSIINQGTFNSEDFFFLNTQLVNKGKGRNYGVEVTVEKFFSKGWYALGTLSLYDSKYKASNGNWYDTRYNGKYVVNVLGGKEWELNSNCTLFADAKLTIAGGQRYTPALMNEETGQPVIVGEQLSYKESEAFNNQVKDYFRMDIKFGIRMNHRSFSHELAFDCRNVTNRANIFTIDYNQSTGNIEPYYQAGITPMGFYRIYF